ncbi:MAG: HAMP domain-containing protein, partial [Rhodoferax sp.]|nr:HAMP domain-containing protein [Rhodoferax sp.]
MFFKKLYVRIWLAVVLAVAVLTFLVGWAWRLTAEPPLREVVIRNEAGQIVGSGQARLMRPPTAGRAGRPADEPEEGDPAPSPRGRYGSGPEFMVRMEDGQTLHMHMPRPPQSAWSRPPFGFFWTLSLVAVAVALATYPIIRKLTRRLEGLQAGVEQWGAGDLSVRIPETGQDEVAFLAKRFNIAAERIETLVKSHE